MMKPGDKVRIHVSREDIKVGRRADPRMCPIARACRRTSQMWRTPFISVGDFGGEPPNNSTIYVDDILLHCELALPWLARLFVKRFDAGRFVFPFSFTARVIKGGAT